MGDAGKAASPLDGDADRADVVRAAQGDQDAFGVLIRRYQHRLVNFIGVMIGDRSEAEDVAQDAFLKAFQGLDRFRGSSSFKTWLYQIALNVARTHVSRRRARAGLSSERDPGEALDQAIGAEDIERQLIDRDRLDRALGALPEEWREVVVLRDIEGLDYKEIAAALDMPMGTVESRLFRARARLREALGDRVASAGQERS